MSYYQISVSSKSESPVLDLYNKISLLFDYIQSSESSLKITNLQKDVFVLREMMPQQSKFSTIATLQGLAKAHAVLDLIVDQLGLDYYGPGIHSVSVKALFKKLTGVEHPEKLDIQQWVSLHYGYHIVPKNMTLDISDAAALWITLFMKKERYDLEEEIKVLKKKDKTLKAASAKQKVLTQIESLQKIMERGELYAARCSK